MLERYEYAKHGACFGFDPDAYFETMVRLNKEFKSSAVGEFLVENYGKTVSRSDFDAAIAKSWGSENVKAIKLSCQGKNGLSDRDSNLPARQPNQRPIICQFPPTAATPGELR